MGRELQTTVLGIILGGFQHSEGGDVIGLQASCYVGLPQIYTQLKYDLNTYAAAKLALISNNEEM